MVGVEVPIHWWRVQQLDSSSRAARERQEPAQLLGGLGWAATVSEVGQVPLKYPPAQVWSKGTSARSCPG